MDNQNRMLFLSSAISDAQELIKFIDAKLTVAITLLSSFIVAYFLSLDDLINSYKKLSVSFHVLFYIFCIFFIFSIIIVVRIIKPTDNPEKNIQTGNAIKPSLKFYLESNTKSWSYPFHNSSLFKLCDNYDAIKGNIISATDEQIIDSLSYELCKVSFIRNIKQGRFNNLIWFLIFTSVFFLISYIFFRMDINYLNNGII